MSVQVCVPMSLLRNLVVDLTDHPMIGRLVAVDLLGFLFATHKDDLAKCCMSKYVKHQSSDTLLLQ